MTYHVVRLSDHTGDVREYHGEYTNHGQAIAKLRGMQRREPLARFSIRKG